jgi:uncharacterized repeat protein (TIGR01451 family)
MSSNGCGCGCEEAPTAVQCCELDCLEAPRFFCGQLLTDQLLNDLMEWTRAKTSLARYRHGWGVVCGLDMSCDHSSPGGIVVGSGYAVSCCGDDIVVCDDARLDLSGACDEGPDPCEELEAQDWRRAVDRPRVPGGGKPGREAPGTNDNNGSEPRAVDVYIGYAEEQSDPQAALARSACGETGRCEYAHTRETYALRWEPAGSGDPLTYAAMRWRERYDEALEVLDAFRGAFQTIDGGQGDAVRSWLLRWLETHHSHHFCFVRDRICEADEDALTDESRLTELLFWIVQDRRNQVIGCPCFGCGPHSGGVPLGRVWVVPGRTGGCRIAGIDPFPPYRRPLSGECWPAALGYVNAGQVIWHQRSEACVRLADLGVRVTNVTEFEPPATIAQLRAALACDPMVRCGDARTLVTYKVEPLGERVVGLCGPVTTPVPDPPKVTVTKTSDPAEGRHGSSVTYRFEVANLGTDAFDAVIEDDLLGEIASQRFEPGDTETFEQTIKVSQDATDPLVNTVTVTATGPGGTTTAEAKHEFRVIMPASEGSLEVDLVAPATVPRGQDVTYRIRVVNDGQVDLSGVQLTDTLSALTPPASEPFDLPVGQSELFRAGYTPNEVEKKVDETVLGEGQTPDGDTVSAEDSASTLIRTGDISEPRLQDITGIGPQREKALIDNGIDTLEELIRADAGEVAELLGPPTTEEHVKRWQEQAKELLGQ